MTCSKEFIELNPEYAAEYTARTGKGLAEVVKTASERMIKM